MGGDSFMKLKERKTFLGNRIKSTLLGLVIMMSVIFCFLSYLQLNAFNQYNEYISQNGKLGKLSVNVNDSWQYFTAYMNGENLKLADQSRQTNARLNDMLQELRPYMQQDTNSSIYFRTLSNMIENYETKSNELMQKKVMDEDAYHGLRSLNTLMTYIEKQENNLTVSYLDYSSGVYSATLKSYRNLVLRIYTLTILALIVGSVFAASVSRNSIRVLKKLCDYARELSDAHWEIPDMEKQRYEELNKLASTFNMMKVKIRDSIDRLSRETELENQYNAEKLKNVENDKLLKESQLTVLQSQMNPHFLFNTLNMISRTALFENAEKTVKLVEATSKILRYNLECQSRLVDLREELNMVRCYITIQKTRFQEQMTFHMKVGEGLDGVQIPPMTIQPIVENAIIHGLREKDTGGVVDITAEKAEGYCVIRIKDNGTGISQKEIGGILGHENPARLGIFNIKERLELNFGRGDLLKIESAVGHGTLVTISVPIPSAPHTGIPVPA
jgi:sensor histidine kinase YesM